jgi:hypothetical protein
VNRTICQICAFALAASVGCAGRFDPRPVDEVGFLERAQTQTEGGIRVTAAVPSARETRALFDENLYRQRVQPIWLEIENGKDRPAAFLPVGLDPEYYSPIEAANLDLVGDFSRSDPRRNRHFFGQGMDMWIGPGETRKGFVFTPLDEGTKAFNVDVVSGEEGASFTFFVPVPGLKIDHYEVDWENLYPPNEVVDLEEADLIEAIARQPCCATDKKGKGSADPLNLIVIGSPDDVYYAFIRAGWDETETITRSSSVKTVLSFITGGEYRYSPVSSLFVFGRKQDVAFQKARETIHERNHLRLWMTRGRFQGKPLRARPSRPTRSTPTWTRPANTCSRIWPTRSRSGSSATPRASAKPRSTSPEEISPATPTSPTATAWCCGLPRLPSTSPKSR